MLYPELILLVVGTTKCIKKPSQLIRARRFAMRSFCILALLITLKFEMGYGNCKFKTKTFKIILKNIPLLQLSAIFRPHSLDGVK